MMKNKFRVLLFCLFAVTADTKAADYSDGKQDNLRNIYSLLEYTPAQWSVLRDFPDAHLLSLMTNFKLKECSPTRLLILKDIVFNKTDKPFCLVPHMKIPSQFTVAHLCSEALTKEVKSISEIIKNINALTLGQLLVISQFPHLHRPEIISDTIEFGYSEATLRSLLVCPLLLRPFVPFFSSDQVKAMTFLPTDVKLYHTLVGLNSRYSPRKIAVLANVIESINRYVEPMEAVQKLDNLCKAIDPLYKIRFIPEKLALLSDEEAVLFERISVDVQLQILREWQIGILFTDEVKALVQLPISGISFFFLAPNRCTQEQLTVLKELPDDCFPLILASKVDITRYSFPKLKMITTMLQDNSDIPNCDIMSIYPYLLEGTRVNWQTSFS